MSEAFVDVSWRGLEVGKRVKLRAIHPGDAYLDHSTPMPVGSTLTIRIDDGVEVVATVTRVHEQVGGSTEIPGMLVVPTLAGAAAAWWQARAEEPPPAPVAAPPVPEPAEAAVAEAAVVASVAPPTASPAALFSAAAATGPDARAAITARPTLTMSTVEVERALAAAAADDGDNAGRTAVMPAMNPEDFDGVVDPGSAADEAVVDDGRNTMVMSAVDVSAIVEAAEVETSGGGDDGPSGDGPSGDGPSGDGPTADRDAGASDSGARGKSKKKGRRKRG